MHLLSLFSFGGRQACRKVFKMRKKYLVSNFVGNSYGQKYIFFFVLIGHLKGVKKQQRHKNYFLQVLNM